MEEDSQILEQAIQRAIDGGWTEYESWGAKRIAEDATLGGFNGFALNDIIFSHDFAKALWGEHWIDPNSDSDTTPDFAFPDLPPYKFHLQQMVIAENPIKYLGEHL